MNESFIRFNSGLFSQIINDRTDVDKHDGACRILKNMIPESYGNASRRPGTTIRAISSEDGTHTHDGYGSGGGGDDGGGGGGAIGYNYPVLRDVEYEPAPSITSIDIPGRAQYIETADEFANMTSGYYKLSNNIDMSTLLNYDIPTIIQISGATALDGCGYTVSNLKTGVRWQGDPTKLGYGYPLYLQPLHNRALFSTPQYDLVVKNITFRNCIGDNGQFISEEPPPDTDDQYTPSFGGSLIVSLDDVTGTDILLKDISFVDCSALCSSGASLLITAYDGVMSSTGGIEPTVHCNVQIENVEINAGCSVTGGNTCGMLVGAISPYNPDYHIYIYNCDIKGTVTSASMVVPYWLHSEFEQFGEPSGEVGGVIGSIGERLSYCSNSIIHSVSSSANVNVEATVRTVSVGGFVGECRGARFINCYCTGNVRASDYRNVGGFVGIYNATGTINQTSPAVYSLSSCVSEGYVSIVGDGCVSLGSSYFGGFGARISANMLGCYSNNGITLTSEGTPEEDANIGGLCGELESKYTTKCYSGGTITSNCKGDRIGGLIGYYTDYGYGSELSNCYTTCCLVLTNLETSDGMMIGGLIGCSYDDVDRCYIIGDIDLNVTPTINPPQGDISYSRTPTNTYFNTEITWPTGKSNGESTADMKKKNTYVDWDFDTIWRMPIVWGECP